MDGRRTFWVDDRRFSKEITPCIYLVPTLPSIAMSRKINLFREIFLLHEVSKNEKSTKKEYVSISIYFLWAIVKKNFFVTKQKKNLEAKTDKLGNKYLGDKYYLVKSQCGFLFTFFLPSINAKFCNSKNIFQIWLGFYLFWNLLPTLTCYCLFMHVMEMITFLRQNVANQLSCTRI